MENWKGKSVQVFLVIVIISVTSAAPSNFTTFEDELNYRLPKTVIPKSYELSLETAVHNNGVTQFGGTVKIELEIVQQTNDIVLHNRGLTINTFKLTDSGLDEIVLQFNPLESDNVRDFYRLSSSNELTTGNYLLEINYHGNLKTTASSGFYRSQYKMENETETRYLAATQFEPTRAREAFPCFDEPEYKTTFKVDITHGSNYHALSNTDGVTVNLTDELSKTTFAITPKMPTYLLAFVVSDLPYYSLPFPGTRHRIYSRPEHTTKTLTSVMFSINFLSLMEEKFSFSFDPEINKMDSVAVPDHNSAMENWGLILYKEQYLLLESNPHPHEMYDVIGTISHEIAHQFFGNAVTCKWWDQIWLNEGFATWLEFQLPEFHSLSKPMRFDEMFTIRKTHVAFRADSLESTRPMTHPANTPSEISDLFDDIAYDKAGAVLRMFQYAIGDQLFTSALNKYLTDYNHMSITSDELLSAIESVLPQPFDFEVTRAFRTWELNKGYPVITVAFDSIGQEFKITQKRYLFSSEVSPADDTTSWYIPLSYTTGASPNFNDRKFTDYFVNGTTEKTISTASISGFDGTQWFIFNIQQLGYYRVNYDESNWKKIMEVLNSDDYDKIHVLNRAQILDDALTFAFDGVISYDIALGIANYLTRETDFIPWFAAMTAFDKLDHLLKGTDFHADFQRFIRVLIRRLYIKYDFNAITALQNSELFAVELAIDWACRAGDEKCLRNAHNGMRTRNMEKPLEITYICNGMKRPNVLDEYEYLFNRMNHSVTQTERLRILNGLLCTADRDILNRFIHTAVVGNTYYRSHEIRKILGGVVEKNPLGLELLAGLIDEHYDDIVRVTNDGYVETLLVDASKRIVTEKDEKIVSDLITELQTQGKLIKQEIKDTIVKNIKFNQEWIESQASSELSIFIHNAVKDYNSFENVLRLPKIAKPEHYEINLDVRNIHTGALPYTGEVKIDVKILNQTDRIILHSKDHEINELKVYRPNMESIPILDYEQNHDVDTLAIYFFESLPVDLVIQVHVKYTAELLTEIDGFYRDSYIEFDEFQSPVTKYLATTQFQAVEARRAFPCFDEPEYRTAFDVSIRHHSTYNAVSNSPINQTIPNVDGITLTIFDPTAPMSTYLLAFLVSDFKYLSNELTLGEGQTLQRIYTRPGKEEKAKYGLENSIKLLEELEDFGGMKFNLPKLDSGAIPGKGGGMENWGLVLYREEALIYEDADEDIAHDARQRGVRLIAHEIVHMFFGDLVTAEWWNYLWLNEGFATYVMYYITDKLYPDWHMKDFYIRNILVSYAFPTDASEHTRSMSSELITVDEINNSFDDIAYDKASCVIRMFHNALGDEIFKEAINLYLKTNEYKAVNSQHLINAVQQTLTAHNITQDFEHIFRTWEMQEGYPVINVEYEHFSQSFVITQERFFDNKSRNIDDNSKWYIPINYATASHEFEVFDDTKITHYFPDDQESLFIIDESYEENDWYIFNKQQMGYYRVNYEEKNWKALTNVLNSENFEKIPVSSRVQLIDDSFALAKAGYIDFEIPYEIIMYLGRETNFFAWDRAFEHIYEMLDIFGPNNEVLNKFLFHLSKQFYNHFDLSGKDVIPNEIMPERYGRQLANTIACNVGNENCIRDAIAFGSKDAKNEQQLPPGLEEEMLCNFFKNSESHDDFINVFNRMNKFYQATEERTKSRFINALACTKVPDFLYEYLETSVGMHSNNVNFTQSEKRNIFNSVLKNPNGMSAVFELINNFNGTELTTSYGWSWSRILRNIALTVYTDSDKFRFLEYLSAINHPKILREDINGATEAADENMKEQELPLYSKQMEFIVNLIYRDFNETTTTQNPTTTPTGSTQTETSSSPADSTSTPTPTTTPASATSLVINMMIILLTFTVGIFISN